MNPPNSSFVCLYHPLCDLPSQNVVAFRPERSRAVAACSILPMVGWPEVLATRLFGRWRRSFRVQVANTPKKFSLEANERSSGSKEWMTLTNLFLVRNGQTMWHAEGRYQGQADPPLSADGDIQARRLMEALGDVEWEAVYASDLERAWETALMIIGSEALIRLDRRWREAAFGEWEGRRFDDVAANDGERLMTWAKDPVNTRPPGGESLREVGQRVSEAAHEVWQAHPKGNVLIVTHGGPIRCLVAEWVLGGLHRTSDVSTELGSITLMKLTPPPEGSTRPIAQVHEFNAHERVRLR